MKCFIWKYVGQCSNNYHSGGGVVVMAIDESRAREIANSRSGCNILDNEMPDDVRDSSGEESVFIFPDAGCC